MVLSHIFDEEIATEYGLHEAIILQNLHYWIEKNKANDTHFYDGMYWTYNSVKAFEIQFPYLTKNKIAKALNSLEEKGLLYTGNYNSSTYNRTKWYALSEKANALFQKQKCIVQKTEMHCQENRNGECENQKSYNIYNNIYKHNTDINTDINTIYSSNTNVLDCQTQSVRRCLDAWNSLSDVGIKQVSKLSSGSKRYSNLLARIKEYGIDDVLLAISKIRNSDFLQGKTNSRRKWVVTFDWFVLPSNFPKVLEGNYDNDEKTTIPYNPSSADDGGWQ